MLSIRTMKHSTILLAILGTTALAACGGDVEVKSPDDAEPSEERAEDKADRAEDKADRAEDKAAEARDDAAEAKDAAN